MLRGSLAAWEREFRARLAVSEEEGELARMRSVAHQEVARIQAEAQSAQARLTREIARLKAEAATREASLTTARKALKDLRGSRVYRTMRQLGRWKSLERDIRNALA